MRSHSSIALLLIAAAACAQEPNKSCFQKGYRLFRPKFTICPPQEATESHSVIHEVRISRPFFKPLNRTVLETKNDAEICISGRADRVSGPRGFLQNSAFGTVTNVPDVPLVGGILNSQIIPKVKTDFCDLNPNACLGKLPPCDANTGVAIQPGEEFCICSKMMVPTIPLVPKLEVDVQWKLLASDDPGSQIDCEKDDDPNKLRAKGKETLVCLNIPAIVKKKGVVLG